MEPDKCEGWEWSTWEEMKNYYELQVEGEKKGNFQGRKLFSPWANMFKNLPDFRPS
jgi:8-oxo-dGTP diphosphatase